MRTWATREPLGEIAYGWKKDAVAAAKPIDGRIVKCRMSPLSGDGWIILLGVSGAGHASELELVACDGRRIPVWEGSSLVLPHLIGLRGGTAKPHFEERWRRVMTEICDRRFGR
jgi:hypothetical protein